MNVVFIVPTGIGAEIGGHSGDATPAAKLIASACDKLIVHPNVVNASDINEMTENMLYVEGSILDRFLESSLVLKESKGNKMLLVVNEETSDIVNAVNGARSTIGADINILELNTPLRMVATITDDKASGEIYGVTEALEQVEKYDFDVLVVNTPIETDDNEVKDYLRKDGGINVWGGVEAKLSKVMSDYLMKPVIHSPVENSEIMKDFKEVVDPRKSSEMVSICYLHCCLKGGHVAPKVSKRHGGSTYDYGYDYGVEDIDFLITPINVWGRPHKACHSRGIKIIAVAENTTSLNDEMPEDVIVVKNYLEAAGVIMASKAGVTLESVQRPLSSAVIHKKEAWVR